METRTVWPCEEVEEVVKIYPGVVDAVVVGIPNQRFGEEVSPSCSSPREYRRIRSTPDGIVEHVKGRLAAYKAPRRVRFVETIGRSPSGKVDYGRHRNEAAEWAGVTLT